MIVRIMGEGQWTLADEQVAALNSLDAGLESAVEAGDQQTFRTALTELLAHVRALGSPLPDDSLAPSDAVLPAADSALDDVRALLSESDEGLIPG
jgi:hypothetical protein